MDDKERLRMIQPIARRLFDNAEENVAQQDAHLIIALCTATDEFIERNRAWFDANLPLDSAPEAQP